MAESFSIKLQALKKRLWQICFPVESHRSGKTFLTPVTFQKVFVQIFRATILLSIFDKVHLKISRKISLLYPFYIKYQIHSRYGHPKVYCKKTFLKLMQNLQKSTVAGLKLIFRLSFMLKTRAKSLQVKKLQRRYFPVNIAQIFKGTPFTQNISKQMLLSL